MSDLLIGLSCHLWGLIVLDKNQTIGQEHNGGLTGFDNDLN
jgi:hypothetical protein